jgi:nucleotide-binding universal stress UspA family protein
MDRPPDAAASPRARRVNLTADIDMKTLLVHMDATGRCQGRIDAAATLARDFGSRLVGVYLVPGDDMSPSIAAMLPAEIVERRMTEALDAQREAEAGFRAAAGAAGVAQVEWRAPAGPPVEAAIAHGRCADLFVLGQRDPEDAAFMFTDELIAMVLLSTGRPVLVVPHIGIGETLGRNVLVAWDGRREATRAVADALPLLARAEQVTVMTIAADRAGGSEAEASVERLTAWLGGHGVVPRISRDAVPDIDIGNWMLSRAADQGADLIVMGGYGHTRLRELVLGGVTRTLLRTMTVPVLMSH